MNIKKFTSTLSIICLVYLSMFVSPALAVEPPTFPSCTNPSGTVRVNYPSGNHGILGQSQLVSGSDTVYDLPGGDATQCFCAEDGSGIQTNFWKISSLSEEEVQQLKNLGWIFIPDGSVWGLAEGPYMAINSNYSCRSTTTTTTSNNNNNDNSSGGGTGGSVLGTSTKAGDVLGLASTGDWLIVYGLGIIGLSSFLLGVYLELRKLR